MISSELQKAIDEQLELSGKVFEQAYAMKVALLQRDAAFWKLRFRHANTMVRLFEEFQRHCSCYYYTADGLGPAATPGTEEYAPGHFVQYKHKPQKWVEIWQNVAEKLLNKIREANGQLKHWKESACH